MTATVNACIPFYEPGGRITCQAEAAVTGKRFVDISDDRTAADNLIQVSHATAASRIFGVAGWDAAIGEAVTVLRGSGYIVPVLAGEAITAGQEVEVGANGVAMVLADGIAVGRAVADADNATDAQIALYDGGGLAASSFAADDHTHG